MVKLSRCVLLVLVIFCVSVNGEQNKSGHSDTQTPFPPDATIQRIIDDRVAEKRSVGIVVLIRDPRGQTHLFHAGSSGRAGVPLDGDAVFEIGSVTKTFTATLLADMVTRSEVSLTDPAGKYLPRSVTMPERGGRQITLVDLATQSSGLPFLPSNLSKDIQTSWATYTNDQLYDFLSTYHLIRDIGEKFEYSDVGVGLLGLVLALRAGKSWEDTVVERILRPLHMSATRQRLTRNMRRHLAAGHNQAGKELPNWEFLSLPGLGALRSSANDLMKYLAANLEPRDNRLGRALTLTHVNRKPAFNANINIGLVWLIGIKANKNILWHGGSTPGYDSFIGFDTVQHTAVVVLSNSGSGITDIGLHLLAQDSAIDDDPAIVRAFYTKLMEQGFERASEIAARERADDTAFQLPESGLNSLGYRLLRQERIKEALEIFKLNVELHPQSANVFDSLAECYQRMGNKEPAIRNYERSLELDPKNENAAKRLEELRK